MERRIRTVTERVRKRSAAVRRRYLRRVDQVAAREPFRARLSCGNLAHGFAACASGDKERLRSGTTANIGIVSAYNDMLSAHQPYGAYPAILRAAARAAGGTAQVAGGTPAMCDGVTQGRLGMQLSLFSRDLIAQATAVGLAHDMFDAVLMLGICDKIVPGLLIGALSFGHLPALFVPGGPMPSGLPNAEKSKVRLLFAAGNASRAKLLDAEAASYHAPGTCTFYGTANSNQMFMEVLGLHLPGSTFINPDDPLRRAFTEAAARKAVVLAQEADQERQLGRILDERAIVNAVVTLLATGGSTNHTIHLVAIARAAGLVLDWQDFEDLSVAVPLLTRIYPNGNADVNNFRDVGGIAFLIAQLIDGGLLHDDVMTVCGRGLRAHYQNAPQLAEDGTISYGEGPATSGDLAILRPVADPFAATGGIRLMRGNLGRGVIKVSAVTPERLKIKAPALVFASQEELLARIEDGLAQDFVAVVRFQGVCANGMPELHKLTAPLTVLQNRGYQVALVTDGRMSGASGVVPAVIHVFPEAAAAGPLARVRDNDMIELDSNRGQLNVVGVNKAEWDARTPAKPVAEEEGLGRELFAHMRAQASSPEQGASIFATL